VTGGKPIAVFLQPISGVIVLIILSPFDIHGGKREVQFFYFVPDTTRDYYSIFSYLFSSLKTNIADLSISQILSRNAIHWAVLVRDIEDKHSRNERLMTCNLRILSRKCYEFPIAQRISFEIWLSFNIETFLSTTPLWIKIGYLLEKD
jgi:hypothetical protein